MAIVVTGCTPEPEISTYTISKRTPAELIPGKQRMLAVIVPRQSDAWFFKIMDNEDAVDGVADQFKSFVQSVEFGDSGQPILNPLPESWRLGGEKPMRFATVYINTDNKQLELSVSTLPLSGDYENYVLQNVNRWRNQVGLKPSEEQFAGGEAFDVASADKQAVLADFVGEPGQSSGSMMPSMAGGPMSSMGQMAPPMAQAPQNTPAEKKYQYDLPEGWRDLGSKGMRELSFSVGPEDSPAEVTLITAGGDLRSNVARWMGQVMKSTPDDAAVDQMLADAETFEVSGNKAQRFIIDGDSAAEQFSIDATIIPTEGGFSKFVKMTGPPATVTEQRDAMKSFLESLSF
ncbi:hypothetical protein LOC67_03945 [Stieleria sp. JC731]|uniref:hypothetical protein n=1 Tax=Pirellulaceae TaxID=2691357 RepID=UPI001E60AE85|nr:hypothetical protein [Stieleria sp. JC731]MCC9599703.1 hypothetical protein [Stieleria sp. JC731]